jgi:glucose-6-phosphate-specific signal transduction histidine kinase
MASFEARKAAMLKEMDLIQEVIKRMSNTSSLIKGWTVTMISVILAAKADSSAVYFVIIPIILFWFLDAYFLQNERQYRRLYAWVVQHRMNDLTDLFSLNATRFKTEGQTILTTMFSFTLGILYGGAILLVIAYLLTRVWFPDWLPGGCKC